jgi:hypothetical protein
MEIVILRVVNNVKYSRGGMRKGDLLQSQRNNGIVIRLGVRNSL